MGFNFGAALGGVASQIVEDIDEQEKEVKLRTRTILDRQVAQTAANQKEYKENKKKVTEQLSALTNLFGNTPEGIAKARAIVAGGDTHFNYMFGKLTSHAENKGDVNKLYQLTPNADTVGFKNVEEATGSLVKMAGLPDVKLGTSNFGANYFKKAQQQYIDAGLIQTAVTDKADVVNYATGKLDLSLLKTKTKTMEQMKNEFYAERNKHKVDSPEYKEFDTKNKRVVNDIQEESVTLKIAEIEAATKASADVKYNEITKTYASSDKAYLAKYQQGKNVYDDDGQIIRDKSKAAAFLQQKKVENDTKFVVGQINPVDGTYNSPNAGKFIKNTPHLNDIAKKVITTIQQPKKPQVSEEEKIKLTKEKYPEPSGFATSRINAIKGQPSEKAMQEMFVQIQRIYQVD